MLFQTKIIFIVIVLAFIMFGCSEEKRVSTLSPSHPDSWLENQSIDFHGTVVLDRGLESCVECHGKDLDGGDSKVSCIDCHLTEGACVSCHGGTDSQNGAPPKGLRGETENTALAVGAHTKHLQSTISAPLLCENCHIVPSSILDSLHFDIYRGVIDSIAEINFSNFNNFSDVVWDRDSATCSDLYCHGNFTGGDNSNVPIWNATNQADCGSCHDVGTNPATLGWKHEFHVGTAGINCSKCHENVVDGLNNITSLELHVNGLIDTLVTDTTLCNTCHGSGGGGCTLCHGGTDNQTGAPPLGIDGETATSKLAVGAHTVHLEGGTIASGINCETCHIVPASISDIGHMDSDSIAELTWGGLSGVSSSWNRATAECSNTYCHGNFTGGDNSNVPIWNATNQADCGSCHDVGTNPATLGWKHEFHVGTAGINCSKCHENVVDGLNNITSLELHVNGLIDTLVTDTTLCNTCHGSGGGGCTLCHGGTDNQTGAPPLGIDGETATSKLAVGAHTVHLEGGTIASGINCETCHIVPASISDIGHMDSDSIAELTWGGLSGVSSSWNRATAECSNTYCHGNFTGGDNSNVPVWNATNQADCGSCHDVGTNPATLGWKHDVHVRIFYLDCQDCHSNVVDGGPQIIELDLHINGFIDTLTLDTTTCGLCHSDNQPSCVGCHGSIDNQSSAPPRGVDGEMLISDLVVGAHTAHVEGKLISDGIECTECHIVPTYFGDPGHFDIDSIAELTWGSLAGFSSSWNRNTAECSNTYCHGNFTNGRNDTPIWTSTNQASCGSCHDVNGSMNSLSGEHRKHVIDENIECSTCHSTVVNSSRDILGFDLHVNGTIEVNITTGGNPNYDGNDCTGIGCHGREGW